MAPPNSPDPGIQELIELQREANKIARGRASSDFAGQATSGVSAFSGALGVGATSLTEFGKGLFDFAGKTLGGVGTAFLAIKDQLYSNIDVWRDLSDKGAGFGNDVIGMSVAAAGAREDLKDFAKQIKENTTAMMGLGGTPGAGAILFGRALKSMYDESTGYIDGLRQMGYQNEQLNEIMALQIGYQHGFTKVNKDGSTDAAEAMNKLATQMDLTARMTGESRKEQQEAAKAAAADMKVEAKFRLIGATQGPEAEKKAREAFAKQYVQAEAAGAGQLFKEFFYAGRAITQGAANQQVLSGGAGEAFGRAAIATSRGDEVAATRENTRALELSAAVNRDPSRMQMVIFSPETSAQFQAFAPAMKKLNNLDSAIAGIRNEEGGKFAKADQATIIAELQRRAEQEQAGRDKNGKLLEGSGVTKALVNMEQRAKDVNSALMDNLVTPLKEKISPALGKFADTVVSSTVKMQNGTPISFSQNLNRSFQSGLNQNTPGANRGYGNGGPSATSELGQHWSSQPAYGLGQLTRGAGSVAGFVGNQTGLADYLRSLNIEPEGTTRDLGTKGILGKDKEPKDTIVKISKDERVLSPEETAAYNAKQNNSVESIFKNLQISGAQGDKIQEQVMSFFGPLLNQVKGMGDAVVSQTSEPVEATPKQQTTQSAQQDTPGKELAGLLVELNKSMAIVAKFAAETADNTKKTVSATQGLSNNRLR